MPEYRKYRRKPDVIAARQLTEDETLWIGPEGFQHQLEGKAGQWVLPGLDGREWGLLTDEEFRAHYETEAHDDDQDRPATNTEAPQPSTEEEHPGEYADYHPVEGLYPVPFSVGGYSDEGWRQAAARQGSRERKPE